MSRPKKFDIFMVIIVFSFLFHFGCGVRTKIRAVAKPSESKRQYLGIKKVAVLPVNNIAGDKGAEDKAMGIIVNELNIMKTFDEIEDPRFVSNVMKALKLRQVTELDTETVQKMGTEMNAQALLLCDVYAWGLGQGTDAAMQISLVFTLIDTTTSKPVWIGSGARRESFSWSRAFGLNEGPTDLEVGREVVISLIKDMNREVQRQREDELARIKAEEEAKLKAAAEAEKRRLEELIQQK